MEYLIYYSAKGNLLSFYEIGATILGIPPDDQIMLFNDVPPAVAKMLYQNARNRGMNVIIFSEVW